MMEEFWTRHETLHRTLWTLKCLLLYGPRKTRELRRQYWYDRGRRYARFAWPTREEWEKERDTRFEKPVTFSLVVPVYNTPVRFLAGMLRSVRAQSYPGWECILGDASDSRHPLPGLVLRAFSRLDGRIRPFRLRENGGISENTNACIQKAGGEYIAILDHDDLLHPSALFQVMKAVEEQGADFVYTDENTFHRKPKDAFNPHYKPDYAPDTLRANNYICHFTAFRKDLLEAAGGAFRREYDGSQDFDLFLRLTEKARKIVHIPQILYYWRAHSRSVAETVGAKPYVVEAGRKAIEAHLQRVGLEGEVLETRIPSMYRLKYTVKGRPLVSILIPNKDHVEDLRRCVDSIRGKSTWTDYEIVIVENNSTDPATFRYYEELEKDPRIRVVRWEGIFNYAAINNEGVRHTRGEQILLLNNDTEVITPEWIEEMLMYAQRADVGAVGVKLLYPDGTIQHAGLGLGLLSLAGHYHRNFDARSAGYMGRLVYAQNVSGVTAACMMIPRKVFEEVGGFDERFEVAFNDVDLCMRIRQAGYLIVFTPFAELTHYESKSRGLDDTPEKAARFRREVALFQERWKKELEAGDPYYNPNLALDREDFSFR